MKKPYKSLYNAVRNTLSPRFQNDSDEVKNARDNLIYELFGKNYKECTDDELKVAIEYCNNKKQMPKRATYSQLKLLRYYQFNCALVYCNFQDFIYKVDDNIINGEDIKIFISERLEQKEKIPSVIFRYMYENWINPTSHRFMLEGDLRSFVKNKKIFHYEFLTPDEANYLIKRYSKMYSALSNSGEFTNLYKEILN